MWEWWFLKFDLPLRNYSTPHTVPCTMAKLMATRSPPPSTLASPPPALFLPCHSRVRNAKKKCCSTCWQPTIEPSCVLLMHACLCVPINICDEFVNISRLTVMVASINVQYIT